VGGAADAANTLRWLKTLMLVIVRKASDYQNSKTGSETITENTDLKTIHATKELSLDLQAE